MRLDELLGKKGLPKELAELEVRGLACDSRKVLPGYVFVALKGTQKDGAQFIPDAQSRGAAVVIRSGRNAEIESQGDAAPIITVTEDTRDLLAQMAKKFFRYMPKHIVAITGTNGKSSVAEFTRQFWQYGKRASASLGTLGVRGTAHDNLFHLDQTTPEPVLLHHILRDMYALGVGYLAVEASSHGLVQKRLDGVKLAAAGFTNLSRDHLDYHRNIEDYAQAKERLFTELLSAKAPAVINAADPTGKKMISKLRRAKREVISVGARSTGLSLMSCKPTSAGWDVKIGWEGRSYKALLPLQGEFQVENMMLALGLCLATGMKMSVLEEAIAHLQAPAGRLELVGRTLNGAEVFVDYAHTPGALERVLASLEKNGKKDIILVFGCGGNRDQGKRSEMGRVAGERANEIILTDDNPRTENPAHIRQQIMAGTPRGKPVHDIGDRKQAIKTAIEMAQPAQTIVVAGKGHETGQTIGTRTHDFSDKEVVEELLRKTQLRPFLQRNKKTNESDKK